MPFIFWFTTYTTSYVLLCIHVNDSATKPSDQWVRIDKMFTSIYVSIQHIIPGEKEEEKEKE